MQIIEYEEKYKSDLIFMILEAKNALGRVPGLNEDLLDIKSNYLDKGDMFWLAIDENDRVIGSICFSSIKNSSEIWLHRFFVKYSLKRQGIGTAILNTAERYAKEIGKTAIRVHLGDRKDFFESYYFYPKHGYTEYAKGYMIKQL